MTEIIIQIDDGTMRLLEKTAAREHLTVSQWIKECILRGLKPETDQWPEGYFSLFGSLEDEEFEEPPEIPFDYDAKRESL